MFSIIQAVVLKQQKVREALNIPKMPDANVAPALKISNPFVKYYEAVSYTHLTLPTKRIV